MHSAAMRAPMMLVILLVRVSLPLNPRFLERRITKTTIAAKLIASGRNGVVPAMPHWYMPRANFYIRCHHGRRLSGSYSGGSDVPPTIRLCRHFRHPHSPKHIRRWQKRSLHVHISRFSMIECFLASNSFSETVNLPRHFSHSSVPVFSVGYLAKQ